MTFNEYMFIYGSLSTLMGVGAFLINQHWSDTFSDQFIIAHLYIGISVAVFGVAIGLMTFGKWVIHLFK